MIKLRRTFDLPYKPDLRILLISVAKRNSCKVTFKPDGKCTIVGIPINVKTASKEFLALWNHALLKQAIVVASLPHIVPRRVETDFMNGFVSQACFYLRGEARVTLNSSPATLAGGSYADLFFQKHMVSDSGI